MLSAGVCCGGKGSFHFVEDKAKFNPDYYTKTLLPKLIEDCNNLIPNGFIFQQDDAAAHTSHLAQGWLGQHTPDFIKKVDWPPNSPDLNDLDFHVWEDMLEGTRPTHPIPKNKAELKTVLQAIWDDLPQESIDRTILSFRSRLLACTKAEGSHFEHLL